MLQGLASASNLSKRALLTLRCPVIHRVFTSTFFLVSIFMAVIMAHWYDMHNIKKGTKPHGVTHNKPEKRAYSPLGFSPLHIYRSQYPAISTQGLHVIGSRLCSLQASYHSSAPLRNRETAEDATKFNTANPLPVSFRPDKCTHLPQNGYISHRVHV